MTRAGQRDIPALVNRLLTNNDDDDDYCCHHPTTTTTTTTTTTITTTTATAKMDFAAILSAEISKKRKNAPKAVATTSTPATSTDTAADAGARPKKYVKRSEVEAQRQAEYEQQQRELAEQRAQRAAQKRAEEAAAAQQREEARERQRKLAEERRQRQILEAAATTAATGGGAKDTADSTSAAAVAAAAASGGSSSSSGAGAGAGGDGQDMPEAEAVEKLRAMGQPARLFGESVAGRIKRCRRLVAARGAAAAAATGEGGDAPPAGAMTEAEMRVELADVARDPARVYRQLDAWFRLVLREWRRALDERPPTVKESFQGRKAAEAMAQADAYMQPLFRHFRLNDLRPIVFEKVCEIVVEAQRRRYVKANDVYLKLSIGNACVSVPALRWCGDAMGGCELTDDAGHGRSA